MFSFLKKKPRTCSVCQTTDQTSIIVGFDPSNRGEFKQFSPRQELCLDHLKEQWKVLIQNFSGIAFCYYPSKGWNSYSYTTLDKVSTWGIPKNEINLIKDFLEIPSYQHNRCPHQNHHFLLVDVNITQEKSICQYNSTDLNPRFLCPNCFVDVIIDEIQSQNLKIDEINTPFETQGVYMNGEY